MKFAIFKVLLFCFLFFNGFHQCQALRHYRFELKEEKYTKLCSTKNILIVNGQFPGPTIHVHKGDTIIVDVINSGNYNVTLHWHGVAMPRNPWSDGPAYITQCPIPPGGKFRHKVIFTREEGTLWWHAHSNWTRATAYGAIIVYPKLGTNYPFPKPHAEVPIILGEWWKMDIQTLYYSFMRKGGDPNISDAYIINGHPGDFYPCSKEDMFKLRVDQGKTYLLRIINAVMQNMMLFGVANHKLTVIGSDGSYTKSFASEYLAISPGQTIDVLLHANRTSNQYYVAAKAFDRTPHAVLQKAKTTGIIHYNGIYTTKNTTIPFPNLPDKNDTIASVKFTNSFRSLASKDHPVQVPLDITTRLFYTLSVDDFPCEIGNTCEGPNNTRVLATMNNITFVKPTIDILESYYHMINGQSTSNFQNKAPLEFSYTAEDLPTEFRVPERGTKVKMLDYNATVELVFEGTSVNAAADHPIHLHGNSFYVVGLGFGKYNKDKDPLSYNLVDPPYQNTVAVLYNGWTAIRFRADNPGVWSLHCHLDRHVSWGMEMVFIVKNGKTPGSSILPPPADMPQC